MHATILTAMPSCPWRLGEHPLARDVMVLHSARKISDPVELAGGPDAPSIVVRALLHFDRCLAALRAYERERKAERDKTKHLP